MLTLQSILSHVQTGDWFVTIDMKDAYFHIQVIKRHRKFPRFAFEGKAYQYCVLAMAPRTFTKCMDVALDQLRLQGVRILNYLDDWLILAQSQDLAIVHWDLVLSHLRSLGLRINLQKRVLLPRQTGCLVQAILLEEWLLLRPPRSYLFEWILSSVFKLFSGMMNITEPGRRPSKMNRKPGLKVPNGARLGIGWKCFRLRQNQTRGQGTTDVPEVGQQGGGQGSGSRGPKAARSGI
ncbi:hypothetical protein PO909_005984 [Leuciscus waleckii]